MLYAAEAKDFAVLARKPINRFRLVLIDIDDLFPLDVLIGWCAGNQSRCLSGVLVPDLLCVGGREVSCKQMPKLRMCCVLRHACVVSRRNQRRDVLGMDYWRPLVLVHLNLAIAQRYR